jgi:hypothetical protein
LPWEDFSPQGWFAASEFVCSDQSSRLNPTNAFYDVSPAFLMGLAHFVGFHTHTTITSQASSNGWQLFALPTLRLLCSS